MSTPTSYHKIIRKTIVAFANLFNNIILYRENADGTENERFVVPIAYATKEKYFDRIEADPEANKKIQITLPRLSYEMTGFSYDASRKLNTNVKTFSLDQNGSMLSIYNPVPYNFNFNLNMYTRTIEDSTQIIENILPYFTPDYTIKLNMIPEMGIVKELPIVLNSSSYDIGYEGDYNSEIRNVFWTLSFTVKGYLFGGPQQPKIIKETTMNQNIYTPGAIDSMTFQMEDGGFGDYKIGELVYQGISLSNATAAGFVSSWNPLLKKLGVTNINGEFTVGYLIEGIDSLASWNLSSTSPHSTTILSVTTTPNPNTALANSNYTYDEVITTFGN